MKNNTHGSAMEQQSDYIDSTAQGLEGPASIQLNRLHKKMDKWQRAHSRYEEQKQLKDIWQQTLLKKSAKKEARVEKELPLKLQERLDRMKQKEDQRLQKIARVKQTKEFDQKETMFKVK